MGWADQSGRAQYGLISGPDSRRLICRGPHSPSKSIRAFTPVFAGYGVNALVWAPAVRPRGEKLEGGHKGRPYEGGCARCNLYLSAYGFEAGTGPRA